MLVSRLHQLRPFIPALSTKFPEFGAKYRSLFTQWDQLLEMERSERDPLLKEMAEQDREHAEHSLINLLLHSPQSKHSFLLPPDHSSIFIELRAATGGTEAGYFANEVLRAYERYCQWKNWRTSLVSQTLDGQSLREATLSVSGDGCYRLLFKESGTHRVQRVPANDSAGRVHTSTITVAVLPDVEDPLISGGSGDGFQLDTKELRIETKRAQGPGGQHVNRTESAIRITHLPTGMQVVVQEQRDQHKNRALALKILRARLYERHLANRQESQSAERRRLIGQGLRSEKVRTYNYPQNRCTDHRLSSGNAGGVSQLQFMNLSRIMEGAEELDNLLNQLLVAECVERLIEVCE